MLPLLLMDSNRSIITNNADNSSNGTSSEGFSHAYVILTAIMCFLSIFGCSVIVGIYVIFPNLRTTSRKLLVHLSIADLLTAVGNLFGIVWFIYSDSVVLHKSMGYCKFHSALTIFSSISSFFWTVTMGLSLYLCIVKNNTTVVDRHTIYLYITCWILPAVIACIALGVDVLGYDQTLDQASWCWIDPRVPNALFWQFFTGKIWEIIAYIITIILYARLKAFLLKQKKKAIHLAHKRKSQQHIINEANKKLTFVPLVFVVLRFWGTLRFLLGVFAHDYASSPDSAWLAPLQGIGDSAQGFANFVLYCFFTQKIRDQLRASLCSCLPKKPKVHAESMSQIPGSSNSNTATRA